MSMMKKLALFAAALVMGSAAQKTFAEDKVDFVKQIKPNFAETCYSCHGPKKQKGKLRLDSPDAIKKGGKDGAVLVPKDSAKSPIYTRVALPPTHDDVMPPSDEGKPLAKEKIDLIKKWV